VRVEVAGGEAGRGRDGRRADPAGAGEPVGCRPPVRRRAPARTVARLHLLALAGMAALPLVVLPCFAVVRPGDLAALANPSLIRVAQAASHALTVVYLLRLGWVAVSTAWARSRLAEALRAAERLTIAGAPARSGYVLPVRQPVAYALGGRAGGVVVSRGLLAVLDDDERDAVLAHELAHLRLGHHRLLWFALVVRATLGQRYQRSARRRGRWRGSWR
jgi:Zn-dependent protease with chaperone function